MSPLLSIPAAAAALGISKKTLYQYVAARKISSHRIGGKLLRISPDEISRVLEEGHRSRVA